MMYQIEFIRFVDSRVEPDIVQRINGEFPTPQAAIDLGTTLFSTIQASGAQGFRIVENGKQVIAHRFKGDM